jgi:hypothetical protein
MAAAWAAALGANADRGGLEGIAANCPLVRTGTGEDDKSDSFPVIGRIRAGTPIRWIREKLSLLSFGPGGGSDRCLRRAPSPPRARSELLDPYVSVGESLSEKHRTTSPGDVPRPVPLPSAVRVGRSRPVASGPRDRTDRRLEVDRYLRHRVWCRGTRFGLSDCAWHLSPPPGVPSGVGATVMITLRRTGPRRVARGARRGRDRTKPQPMHCNIDILRHSPPSAAVPLTAAGSGDCQRAGNSERKRFPEAVRMVFDSVCTTQFR